MRRTGIDVSSTGCVLVDAECIGRRRRGEPATFRVHGFAAVSSSRPPLASELKLIARNGSFPRRAWVNLWEVRSSHQYRLLPAGREADLEAQAKHHGASVLEMDDEDVTVATELGRTRTAPGGAAKREVSFFAASTQEVRDHLRPIIEAGFIVEGVTTPCGALWSQARLRRPAMPADVHAFVALGASQSALGIFSEGFLLYARDLEWGYAPPHSEAVLDREELAWRLSVELERSFLYVKQFWEPDVTQIVLCGDMPNIRSLTAPLIERLNLEVETLDTLEGIDPASLPPGFAERAAAFRLASAIAVEPPPANLLPFATAARRWTGARRVAMSGTAAAVMLSALLYGEAELRQRNADLQASGVDEQLRRLSLTPVARESPGPAIGDVLRRVADATPRGVRLTSLRVEPHADHWKLLVEAHAPGLDLVEAKRDVERFLAQLAAISELGEPLSARAQKGAETDGMQLAATYQVRK